MKRTGLRQPFLLTALCAAMLMPSAAALAVTDAEILKDATTTDEIVTCPSCGRILYLETKLKASFVK